MKVRMRTLAAGPSFVRQVGKVYDVTKREAEDLIAGGYAEAVAASVPVAPAPEAAAMEGAPETAALPAAQTKPGK